ncbi:MBL fold metallo-hydrolase [Aliikangiella maris]|uniref:MBL fold metallo-hydrolase n=2 Tax=Aliikangiella maris TaxID=3162458 RepID=A0ABV3ML47_9GAMM
MALRVEIVKVTPFQQNCSLIWCDNTQQGAIIDPGGDIAKILNVIEENSIEITQILLTHGHLDHAGGATDLAAHFQVAINGPHIEDKFLLDAITDQAKSYGFTGIKNCHPSRWLDENEEVTVGEEVLSILHCPGHTPGHIVFYHQPSQLSFVGDVIFRGSIGRTDFPRGDYTTLIQSITQKLWPLGRETRFVPGHGPISNFDTERKSNRFVSDEVLAQN